MKLVYLLIGIVIFFSSCTSNRNGNVGETAGNGKDSAGSVYVHNLYDGTGVGRGDGYYYVDIQANGVQNIKYIDYNTATETFLCGRPECTHDDETCPSVVTPYGGAVCVFPYNENIFILYTGSQHNDRYLNKYGDKALPRLEKRESDGSNAQTVFTLNANESTVGNIAFLGDSVYITVEALESENSKLVMKYYLCNYNLNSGNCISKLLLEYPCRGIISGNDNYLVIESVTNGSSDISNTKYTCYKYCVDDGSVEIIADINPRWNFTFLSENNFYIVDKENNSLICYNMNTMEPEIISDTLVTENELGGVFCHTNDGVLLFTYSADGFEVRKEYYDLHTKTLKKISIPNKYEDSYTDDAPMILAENDEFYLIVVDNRFEDKGFYTYDGNVVTFRGPTYKKALITKENYSSNNCQLIDIIEN